MAERLSDPTKPPEYQEVSAGIGAEPQWSLKSILISPTRRSAILNGRVVKKGEQLDQEVTVLDILPGSVLLKGAEGEFSVNLLPASVKMPVKTGSFAP
ncbi:MAG: general secretion pathway protein GspB [Gammaproteobacteria bacterium]|nr:general secretion pathway protein GspB [Gammaproteobacteria bacterium]